MANSEQVEKKNAKQKKHPRVVRVLKKFVGAIMITKQILDLEVNFTVSKLLAFAPAIKKLLTKAITEDEAI